MANKDTYKSIMLFVIKIAVLVGVYYYFSQKIYNYAGTTDLGKAAAYSGAYAGVVLFLLLMFRWSGFIARALAGLIGIAALSAVIIFYMLSATSLNGPFIGSYLAIEALAIYLGHAILFKKI